MGKGGEQGGEPEAQIRFYTWEEIQKHNLRTDKWLVIERKVYNVTKWANRHPGGQRVISHCAGEDATVRTTTPHPLPPHLPHQVPPCLPGGSLSQLLCSSPPPRSVCSLSLLLEAKKKSWSKWMRLLGHQLR